MEQRMMKEQLNKHDIMNLSNDPRIEIKSLIAQKVTQYYSAPTITQVSIKLAEDIFRIMVRDVETKVREVLSESLKDSHNIPKDIIYSLINDTDSVAVPFIKYYADFTDEDLIRVLKIPGVNKHKAVAQRINLPQDITQYITDRCSEDVIKVLINNTKSQINENAYTKIIDKFHDNESIKRDIIHRTDIPTSIIEKITHHLSEELKKNLILSHNLPTNLAMDLVQQIKEKATLRISQDYSSDKQIEELVEQLYKSNRLTSNLVVRSICMADMKFFEYSLAYLANIPLLEVRKTLFNISIDFMIRNLLRKAEIPNTMFPAVFSALKIIKETQLDYQTTNNNTLFSNKVIERLLTYTSDNDDLSEEDINYLISKIS